MINLLPYTTFDYSSTRRRRNDDYQAALNDFFKEMDALHNLWNIFRNIQEESAENKRYLDKKMQEELDYINTQIAMRYPIIPQEENIKKTNDIENITQALQCITAEIQQIDEALAELAQLEMLITEQNEKLLKELTSCYDLLGKQSDYTQLFKYASLETKDEYAISSFWVSLEEIHKHLAIEIPKLLKANQISPHEVAIYEEKLIEEFIKKRLAENIYKEHPNIPIAILNARVKLLEKSPRFYGLIKQFVDQFKEYRSKHVVQERLNENLGALSINQENLKQAKTMREALINRRNQALLMQNECLAHFREKNPDKNNSEVLRDISKKSAISSGFIKEMNKAIGLIRNICQDVIGIKNKAAEKHAIQSALDEKNDVNPNANRKSATHHNLKKNR